REQLAEQVAVALLQVDEIEPGAERERGRLDVTILEAIQLVVGDQRVIGPRRGAGGLVDDRPRIEQRVVLRKDPPGDAVAARVRELEADEEVGIVAPRLAMRGAANLEEVLQSADMALVADELTRVGPPFRDDGGGLAPNELRAAGAETLIAADR